MTIENLNLERQIKLHKFFDDQIDLEHFAKIIRRYNHQVMLMIIREDEDSVINKKWIDDGFYFLNEFAEIIDPNLNQD